MYDVVGIDMPCLDFVLNVPTMPKPNSSLHFHRLSFQGGNKVSTGMVAAARLGAKAAILGAVGDEAFGRFCVNDFERHGITSMLKMRKDETTALCFVLSDEETKGRSIVYHPGSCARMTIEELPLDVLEHDLIGPALIGMDASNQMAVDHAMLSLMPDAKLHLGGNATAAVSAAVLKAGANALGIPLYRHIGGANAMYLPVPGVAMVAGHERYGGGVTTPGGKPTMSCMCFGFDTFAEASYACWDIHTRWAEKMKKLFGGTPNIRDFIVIPEGIFRSDEAIWESMTETIIQAGYEGKVGFQMDIATDTYHNKEDGKYYGLFSRDPKTKDQLYDFYLHMIHEFPFVILEDPFNEDDYDTTAAFTKDSGIQIVGDDLFTTNPARVEHGIAKGAANTILLKVNQIGTITEALQMIQYAYKFGYAVMPSDSRGEGESIGDYAVGINAGSIRESGIGPRGNRLLEIEEELGPRAQFIGARGLKGFRNQARAAEMKKED